MAVRLLQFLEGDLDRMIESSTLAEQQRLLQQSLGGSDGGNGDDA